MMVRLLETHFIKSDSTRASACEQAKTAGNRPMADAYRSDLAYIHDVAFGHFARSAAPVLLAALRRSGLEGGLVIDLGCGSGILTEKLSEAGYDVLGIDISGAMLAIARERVPNGQFREESLLKAELPSCVAVAAVGECVNYMFDRGNTSQGLARLFRRIHEALRPGGLLLFDMAGPGRVSGANPSRNYFEGADWAVLVSVEEDRRRRSLTRRITSFRKVGDLYRREHEVHRLRLVPREDVVGQLRSIGFRVRVLRGYGSLRFPPGWAGFLAHRR
jgi:SAM-dependent methyltransferase